MVSIAKTSEANGVPVLLWGVLWAALFIAYLEFFRRLWSAWGSDPEFSFGVLIPILVAYLIWTRKVQLTVVMGDAWHGALILIAVGCCLQVLANMSGTLFFSGIALTITLIGIAAFIWGRSCMRTVAGPLALLILMVPLPSYMVGELSWHLQARASSVSAWVLGLLGVPVLQDGNLLRLSNYVLEVKQACSGSRSIFALLALACWLGLSTERKWWMRILLVAAAPVLAVGANVVRIVGTGLIASNWGELAANESLHAAWGIAVFLMAVMGLLGLQRLLRWATHAHA
jgi:exosortase